MLVFVQLSSMNTSCAGSNIPCLRIQRRRSRATSARFCSAAYKVFFEADVASIEEPPNRTTAARDSPLPHRRNHLVQRQIRLPGNQTQQKPRIFLQRRCAAATRLCRNASGLLKALGPKHHHTGADPIVFGRLPPRRACQDVSDHADTQVHGIKPRHRLTPSPNQGGQTRSLTSAWESLRFNPSGICSSIWQSIVAPAGTPRDIVTKLHGSIRKVLALPEVREKLLNA